MIWGGFYRLTIINHVYSHLFRQAHARYQHYLIEQKAKETQKANKRKAGEIEEEIEKTKKKLKVLEATAQNCIEKADRKEEAFLKKQNVDLITEAVALRKQGKDIQSNEIPQLKQKVESLKQKLVQK